jgi:hypothetical protein
MLKSLGINDLMHFDFMGEAVIPHEVYMRMYNLFYFPYDLGDHGLHFSFTNVSDDPTHGRAPRGDATARAGAAVRAGRSQRPRRAHQARTAHGGAVPDLKRLKSRAFQRRSHALSHPVHTARVEFSLPTGLKAPGFNP